MTSSMNSFDLLAFEEMRHELSTVTTRFDLWMARKQDALLQDKTQHKKQLMHEQERIKVMECQVATFTAEEQQLRVKSEQEQRELAAIQQQIEELVQNKDFVDIDQQQLSLRIQEITSEVKKLRLKKANREAIKAQRDARNEPELACVEDRLGLYIAGVKDDVMKFTFTCIDEKNCDREFFFYIDVSGTDYQVMECVPQLPNLQELVSKLNEHRDFYVFLKEMRQAFVDLVKRF